MLVAVGVTIDEGEKERKRGERRSGVILGEDSKLKSLLLIRFCCVGKDI